MNQQIMNIQHTINSINLNTANLTSADGIARLRSFASILVQSGEILFEIYERIDDPQLIPPYILQNRALLQHVLPTPLQEYGIRPPRPYVFTNMEQVLTNSINNISNDFDILSDGDLEISRNSSFRTDSPIRFQEQVELLPQTDTPFYRRSPDDAPRRPPSDQSSIDTYYQNQRNRVINEIRSTIKNLAENAMGDTPFDIDDTTQRIVDNIKSLKEMEITLRTVERQILNIYEVNELDYNYRPLLHVIAVSA